MAEQRAGRTGRSKQPFTTPTPPKEENSIDLVELMYRLLGSWKLIVCLALAGAILMGCYTQFLVTPMYSATSTIYVLSRSDSAINMADLQIGTALTSDYIKVFDIWEVHEKVISNLNLPYSYKEMASMLSVSNPANTRMLDITVTNSSAEEAAAIANEYATVVSQYIAQTMSTEAPSLMSVALTPSNPVSPNKTKNVMLGFLLGMVVAMAIVTVRMLMDDTYKTADDIRRYTGLATLALIPVENAEWAHPETKKHGRKARK